MHQLPDDELQLPVNSPKTSKLARERWAGSIPSTGPWKTQCNLFYAFTAAAQPILTTSGVGLYPQHHARPAQHAEWIPEITHNAGSTGGSLVSLIESQNLSIISNHRPAGSRAESTRWDTHSRLRLRRAWMPRHLGISARRVATTRRSGRSRSTAELHWVDVILACEAVIIIMAFDAIV